MTELKSERLKAVARRRRPPVKRRELVAALREALAAIEFAFKWSSPTLRETLLEMTEHARYIQAQMPHVPATVSE